MATRDFLEKCFNQPFSYCLAVVMVINNYLEKNQCRSVLTSSDKNTQNVCNISQRRCSRASYIKTRFIGILIVQC